MAGTIASASHPEPEHMHPLGHGKLRIYSRAVTDLLLLLTWIPATVTGVLLWEPVGVVPDSPGRGKQDMLWGLTTGQWGDIHWWVSAAAVGFTLLHFALDWKMFKGGLRYLFHRHEATGPGHPGAA